MSDKEDSSAQDVALQLAYRPVGLLWPIGYVGKYRICGLKVSAKLVVNKKFDPFSKTG